jgi:hypothetical protein
MSPGPPQMHAFHAVVVNEDVTEPRHVVQPAPGQLQHSLSIPRIDLC